MNTDLMGVIDRFDGLKVLVVGEAMLDSYLVGTSERLCREAPVPVVAISEREHAPGGAANTAVNVSSLGAEVLFLSATGDDPEGDLLRQALESSNVSTGNILRVPHRSTLAKQRIISGSQMVVRFDQGSTEAFDEAYEQKFIERLEGLFPQCDAVIVSDYNYGVLTRRVIKALARLQRRDPRLVVVDSKRLSAYRSVHITAVKPNYDEALQLLNLEKPLDLSQRVAQIEQHGEKILRMTGAQIGAITLDQDGALFFEKGRLPYRTYAHPQPNSQAPGAGDTFVAVLSLSLAAGAHTENAAELASAAASIVVEKDGTAICFADELRAHFSTGEKFVTDVFQLAARMAAYRLDTNRLVFTNGCFDILHRGHINYLNQAKALGDVLIVGLNTDASVKRLKGPSRPINPLEDRAQVLAALSCVDLIVPFEGDTPRDLIRVIKPDVFVKGGDYTREKLPEAELVEELGGKVHILPYLDDHSTTSIIERIRKLYEETPAENQ